MLAVGSTNRSKLGVEKGSEMVSLDVSLEVVSDEKLEGTVSGT